MTASLRTILTLLTLTTFTRTTTASTILQNEVYRLPDYPYLSSCQQKCIAGEPSNQAYPTSIFYITNCETKACFCPQQNEPQIGQQAQKCLEGVSGGACATVLEYNGLMAFVAKYCGFEYAPATTGLLFPPSGGGGAGATSTPGATASCWDRYGHPVQTCSSTMTTATRTSSPYWSSSSTADSQATEAPAGGKGKGGLSIGKIIGFAILGFFGVTVYSLGSAVAVDALCVIRRCL
ncbi:unnamed protein product [Tuber aestivum]|uniref:Extracellular membrane protein CFEM domain-containing protein n=1 Tax=Tuber aestivum TaxID=59557 RepID=A0A292PU96_9PEZI|nr:unnamed protein product [Tuber aestivum]